MKHNEAKQAVYELVARCKRITFSEIEEEFTRIGYEYEGEWAQAVLKENPKVFYWIGWTPEAIDIINELRREEKIHFKALSVWEYLIVGGRCLTLPVIKSVRVYKTDHWIPVAICFGKGNE